MRQAIFSLHEGDMQLCEYGVFGERSLDQLPLGADGRLELSSRPRIRSRGNWHPDAPTRARASSRSGSTIADWERDALPSFQIERVGAEGEPPPPLEPAALAAALERAARWVERASVDYWNRYTGEGLAARDAANVAAPARSAPGGADNILYGSCFWELAQDEALVLECRAIPDADYWNFIDPHARLARVGRVRPAARRA